MTKPIIVAVNDDMPYLKLLQEVLGDEGYLVHICLVTKGAYDFIKDEKPQLVILDLLFNGTTAGLALLDQLKTNPETQTIPLLICSAHETSLHQHHDRLRRHSCSILVKPFHLDDLLAAVQTCLAGRALARS